MSILFPTFARINAIRIIIVPDKYENRLTIVADPNIIDAARVKGYDNPQKIPVKRPIA
jgi:hypothetical protein